MSSKLDWFNPVTHLTTGVSARLPATYHENGVKRFEGNGVKWDNVNAAQWDLFTAVSLSYADREDFWLAIKRLKVNMRILFPTEYNNSLTCYMEQNDGIPRRKQCYPFWRITDDLTVEQVTKLLKLSGV